MTCLTGEQLCEFSWFGGLSWLLLAFVDLSSVLLPGHEEEKENEKRSLAPLGCSFFTPADKRHKTEKS